MLYSNYKIYFHSDNNENLIASNKQLIFLDTNQRHTKSFFSQLDHFNSFFLVDVCLSIRLLEVTIPPHAIRGQNSKLNCNYDMEGDKLYSIKWYRNGQEFYRFIPSDEPKTTVFNGDGINVDVSGFF